MRGTTRPIWSLVRTANCAPGPVQCKPKSHLYGTSLLELALRLLTVLQSVPMRSHSPDVVDI